MFLVGCVIIDKIVIPGRLAIFVHEWTAKQGHIAMLFDSPDRRISTS